MPYRIVNNRIPVKEQNDKDPVTLTFVIPRYLKDLLKREADRSGRTMTKVVTAALEHDLVRGKGW